ncbi:chemotaxis protein CheW [Chryseolinea sp. T2]|uniref:chemotaxis protein CheW n=1 Tax=Chryseolinea sp. T2 TaxID=3129255 RepID=UPI0030787D0D
MELASAVTQSYLTFRLDDELFATSVINVIEILELTRITKVPRSPSFMRGVINLRGTVLPVIDARQKFGLDKTPDTVNTCILVLNIQIDNEKLTVGALVDAVQEVLDIDISTIQPAPSIGSRYKSEFIDGMVKGNDKFIMLLNVSKVFSSEEVSILKEGYDMGENTSINQ